MILKKKEFHKLKELFYTEQLETKFDGKLEYN
jgi:hypothetical protein